MERKAREYLIEAARSGNGEALSALLGACQPDLRRYAQRRCASKDVDDAVQDALLILHDQFRALRYATALSGWLFRVIQRLCARMGYREHNLIALDDTTLTAHRPNFQNLRLDLERALLQLEPAQLQVLVLRDMYGYTSNEVALQLNITPQAVKSRLHRARANVRETIGKGGTL